MVTGRQATRRALLGVVASKNRLVVDDEPDMLENLLRLLGTRG
jgi:hypothetical protein